MTDPSNSADTPETLVLEDEAGNETEFEITALVPFEERDYLLLRPLEAGVLEEETDLLVLRLDEDGEGVDFVSDDAEFARFVAHLETLDAG